MNDVVIKGFGELNNIRKSKQSIYTSIQDEKVIFNLLNTECDFKLNECENKEIKVKDTLIKVIETPSDTGEVVFKKITILYFFLRTPFACPKNRLPFGQGAGLPPAEGWRPRPAVAARSPSGHPGLKWAPQRPGGTCRSFRWRGSFFRRGCSGSFSGSPSACPVPGNWAYPPVPVSVHRPGR